MTNSRRNFCKNSIYISLGLSFSPLITQAKTNESISKKFLSLRKRAEKAVNVYGKICYEDLSPARNAVIEIWHNNSETNQNQFEYTGKLQTDAEGNYRFDTDFPERHFGEKYLGTRRINFKIKDQNGEELLTKLHFGYDGNTFVDNFHVNVVPDKFKLILPETKFEEDLYTVQFDIYLKTKVVASVA